MKRFCIKFGVFIFVVIIGSCKPFEYGEFEPTGADFSEKLPRMELITKTSGKDLDKYGKQLFKDEASQWMEEKGKNHGAITVNVATVDNKAIYGLFLGVFTAGTAAILGAPLGTAKTNADVGVRIFDKEARLLAKYKAVGRGKANTGLYFWYGNVAAVKVAKMEAYKEAFNKIRTKVRKDIPELRKKLTSDQ